MSLLLGASGLFASFFGVLSFRLATQYICIASRYSTRNYSSVFDDGGVCRYLLSFGVTFWMTYSLGDVSKSRVGVTLYALGSFYGLSYIFVTIVGSTCREMFGYGSTAYYFRVV